MQVRRIDMKRRNFLSMAAGIGTGSMIAGSTSPANAQNRPAEKPLQIYICQRCGTILQIFKPGSPSLVHCGQPMELLVEKTEDTGSEKHVPVIEKIKGGYKVKVGSVAHPMADDHSIVGIQLIGENMVYSKQLKPGDKPEAIFMTDCGCEGLTARAYCNLHGLWKSK
jgi:superoxide reductase